MTNVISQCRYARDWILTNEKLVSNVSEAIQVGQAMLDLSIFHCVTNSSAFEVKQLYAFRSDNLGSVAHLRCRVVAIEDQNIAQTKANKEAQADAITKSVQLDWRISVAERRLSASENALRRTIAQQQVCCGIQCRDKGWPGVCAPCSMTLSMHCGSLLLN
jgi:hypothetical protein